MPMYFQLVFALLIWHAIADYPLQGDFLAKAKNHKAPIPGIWWAIPLVMHGLIHAGGVWLITGFVSLAIIELILHCIIDHLKCRGSINFAADQFAHYFCKLMYAHAALKMSDWQFQFFQGLSNVQ